MNSFHRTLRSLPTWIIAISAVGISSGNAPVKAQGHGGGAGHVGAGGGYGGYGGYGGRGYGYGRYGYGGYGWGYGGFGWGLGLGLGLGYYGAYPYYGYPYGYPYGPYPYPYGYPGFAAAPPSGGAPTDPVGSTAGSPIVPVVPSVPTVTAASAPGDLHAVPPVRSPDTDVTLIVRTPADATVWINGVKTTQTGARREFVSSGLAQGRNYTFDVRAQWMGQDGKMVDLHRRIPAQAGERRSIDFILQSLPQGEIRPVEFGNVSK